MLLLLKVNIIKFLRTYTFTFTVKFYWIISKSGDNTIWMQCIYCQLLLTNFFSQFIDTQFVHKMHKTWRRGSHFVTIVLANKIDPLIKLANEKVCAGKFAINILCTVIGFISNLLHLGSFPFFSYHRLWYSYVFFRCRLSHHL